MAAVISAGTVEGAARAANPRNYAPHGVLIGDVGDMYMFTCDACPDRPLAVETQCG